MVLTRLSALVGFGGFDLIIWAFPSPPHEPLLWVGLSALAFSVLKFERG